MKSIITFGFAGCVCVLIAIATDGLADEPAKPPREHPIPNGPLGDSIRLGRELVEKTMQHPLYGEGETIDYLEPAT